MSFKKLVLVFTLIFMAGCGNKNNNAEAQKSSEDKILTGLKGKIIFQSDKNGNREICRINTNGGNLVNLTNNPANDEYPGFSPEARQIAFKSDRTGKWQIFVMDSDGRNQRQITRDDFENYDPVWMPDGKHIAFTSDRGNGERVYLINLDTGEEKLLTEINFRAGLAAFSPDGKKMLFTGNELGWNIYLMDLETKEIKRITSRGGSCRPDWSPDAKTIAFVTDRSDNIGDIWLMDAEGQNQRRLTMTSELSDYYPAWSPDGDWIVYAASPDGKDGNWNLYIIKADGSERTQLTFDEANSKFPDWSE